MNRYPYIKPLSKIIFDTHDKNSDGYLNMSELHNAFYSLGKYQKIEEMPFYLTKIDQNNDKQITYSEFLEWWRNMDKRFDILTMTEQEQQKLQYAIKHFQYFDIDKSGELDAGEGEIFKDHLKKYGYVNVDALVFPLKLEDYVLWLL
jgi:Ca2+-binding EF-hand superfamily protein